MPVARSPPGTRSRSRQPAVEGNSGTPIVAPPPQALMPEVQLGSAPPATPVHQPQPFIQPPKKGGKSKAAVVEDLPSKSLDSSTGDEPMAGNSNITMERGRTRTQPSSVQDDPVLIQLLKVLTETVTSNKNLNTSSGSGSFKTPAMKSPEPFEGNLLKLRNFIQSCQLIFYNDERTFASNKKKVVYAASFLTGKAGKWIEPYLAHLNKDNPTFLLNSWKDFESQLFTLFGNPNEVHKAEKDLDNLQMKEGA